MPIDRENLIAVIEAVIIAAGIVWLLKQWGVI